MAGYFDAKAAKAEGATDADIAYYLGEQYGVDVDAAMAKGLSESAIASELLRLDERTYKNDLSAKSKTQKAPDVSKMSGLKQFQLGVGSGLTDLTMGAKDLVGLASDQEVMAKREADKAINKTGAGFAGNIAGKVVPTLAIPFGAGANLLAKPMQAAGMVLNSGRLVNAGTALAAGGIPTAIADATAVGGLLGALETTAGDESRAQNAGIGAAVGSVLPVAGAVVQGVKGLAAPFTKAGQQRIAGNTLNSMASNPQAVRRGLANSAPLVPGTTPTTAAVTGDLGLASAERTARGLAPQDFAAQDAANNAARVAALRGIAQTPEAIAAAEQARKSSAVPILREASATAQGVVDKAPLLQSIDGVLAGPARKRDAATKALQWIRGKVDDENLTFDDLYAIRQDIDDAMAGRLANDEIKGIANARREVMAVKRQIDKTLNEMSGGKFGEYTRTWAGASKPIEQMKAGQEIMAKGEARATDAMGNPRLRSGDIRGFMVKKGENRFGPVFSDEQQGILSAIANDIDRSNITDAVRPRGSDTFQNLAQDEALKRAIGESTPIWLRETVRKSLGWAYRGADQDIQDLIVTALRDPNEAARLLSMMPDDASRSALAKTLRTLGQQSAHRLPLAAPVGLLSAPSLSE